MQSAVSRNVATEEAFAGLLLVDCYLIIEFSFA